VIARLCGHAIFGPIASGSLHFCPSLISYELDPIDTLKPDPEPVRKAIGVPLGTSRNWLAWKIETRTLLHGTQLNSRLS